MSCAIGKDTKSWPAMNNIHSMQLYPLSPGRVNLPMSSWTIASPFVIPDETLPLSSPTSAPPFVIPDEHSPFVIPDERSEIRDPHQTTRNQNPLKSSLLHAKAP